MASFSPSRMLKYFKASLIFLSIPLLFLVYILLNVLKKVAPKFLFKIATTKLPKFNQWKFSQKITGIEDLDFLFSYDIFEVGLNQKRLLIKIKIFLQWKVVKGIENVLKKSTLGSPAPDVPVLDVATNKVINLLSNCKEGRPMVLNFGSCS